MSEPNHMNLTPSQKFAIRKACEEILGWRKDSIPQMIEAIERHLEQEDKLLPCPFCGGEQEEAMQAMKCQCGWEGFALDGLCWKCGKELPLEPTNRTEWTVEVITRILRSSVHYHDWQAVADAHNRIIAEKDAEIARLTTACAKEFASVEKLDAELASLRQQLDSKGDCVNDLNQVRHKKRCISQSAKSEPQACL